MITAFQPPLEKLLKSRLILASSSSSFSLFSSHLFLFLGNLSFSLFFPKFFSSNYLTFTLKLQSYTPVQPVRGGTHGVSLIPLNTALFDLDIIQRMHHGMTVINYDVTAGRSVLCVMKLDYSCSILSWYRVHYAGDNQDRVCNISFSNPFAANHMSCFSVCYFNVPLSSLISVSSSLNLLDVNRYCKHNVSCVVLR